MPEISVDKAEVVRVAGLLKSNSSTIVADLTALQAAVQTLLADPAGGLWLAKASPVLAATYTEFNKMLTDAINNIPSFAESFENTVKNIDDLDQALSKPPSPSN